MMDYTGLQQPMQAQSCTPPPCTTLANFSDHLYQRRIQSLLSVDDLVGALHQAVVDGGVLDSTFFLYMSDHGYSMGQFNLPSGKFNVYEHDTRIPTFMSGPGIAAGTTIGGLVANVDLSPTICEIAGVKPHRVQDGKSFLPLAQGKESSAKPWRTELLIEYWGLRYHFKDPRYEFLR